jgi:hypothetical protein
MNKIVLSKDSVITIDDVAFDNLTSYSLDRTLNALDAAHLPDDHEKSIAGNASFSFSASGDFDPTDPTHTKLDGTKEEVIVKVYPAGITVGYGYSLPCIVTKFGISAPKGDKLTFSAEFTPAGPLTKLGA